MGKKIIPFLLSLMWLFLALTIELSPKTPNTFLELMHNFFKRVDYLIYDIRQLATLKVQHKTNKPIVIIEIDDISIKQEGRWPWSYKKVAQLIEKLRGLGASHIALDIVFNESEKNIISEIKQKIIKKQGNNSAVLFNLTQLESDYDVDKKIIEQVTNKNDIILPFFLLNNQFQGGELPPAELIVDPKTLDELAILSLPGYINNFKELQQVSLNNGFKALLTDEDGVVRRSPLVSRIGDRVYISLPLAIAKLVLAQPQISLNTVTIDDHQYLESIQLGHRNIPTDKLGRILIPFYGKKHSFQYYSATDVLNNKLKPNALKNKIVFIGATAALLDDVSNTSVDKSMPEVEVDANVFAAILDGTIPHLAYWAKAATIGLTVLIGITLAILFPLISPGASIVLAALTLLTLVIANVWLWTAKGVVFSFSVPFFMTIMLVLTNMAYGFLFESRKKKLLRETFSQYVASDYVKILMDNPDTYSLDGETVELTVLFVDIRDFTHIAEQLDAAGVKKLLNQFLTPMTEIILQHRGTVDKYVGDMIMAFWGAPIKNNLHREATIDAALAILTKSEELKATFIAGGYPAVDIGIGINSGLMNVGDMGSEFRRSYTVIGDPVNLASRLESATKYYGVKLLVGNETQANQTQFVFRWVDKVRVKGKNTAVDIYEVLGRIGKVTPALSQEIKLHAQACQAYKERNWPLAHEHFTSLVEHYPNTKLYSLFLKRVTKFKKKPPPSDWDGATELQQK